MVDQAVGKYLAQIGMSDAYALKQYYERMNTLDQKLDVMLKDFVIKVEDEYKKFMEELNLSLNPALGTSEQRRIASVNFATDQGVALERVFRTPDELRYWMGE